MVNGESTGNSTRGSVDRTEREDERDEDRGEEEEGVLADYGVRLRGGGGELGGGVQEEG